MRVNKNGFILGVLFSIIYVALSFYWSLRIDISGDTLVYQYIYMDILNSPFPWPLEYFTSAFMWLTYSLGFDFRSYLFLNYIIWLPVVFYLFYKSERDVFIFLIGAFFLSYLFYVNVPFLIRQYNSFLFFILFFLSRRGGYKYSFLALMFLSHLSAVILYVLSHQKVSDFTLKNKKILTIVFIPLSFIGVGGYYEVASSYILNRLGIVALEKKVVGANAYIDSVSFGVQTQFIILNAIIIFVVFFSKNINARNVLAPLLSLIFISSMLYIFLWEEPIMANRVAFVAFGFAIPSLLLVLRGSYGKFR